jgi:DNA-binding NtrC family response regulator
MQRVYRMIERVSQHSYPVLILGESGTGKELVARSVHFQGPRKNRPFVPVDCSSLVPTLIESELFGHVKGAFTGAQQNKAELLEAADDGTLFLDEIGDLPVEMQSKLLRALQEPEVKPVGSNERRPLRARVISATNRDLVARASPMRHRLMFVTGDTLAPRTLEFLEKSGLPFLTKPFLVGELKAVVERALLAAERSSEQDGRHASTVARSKPRRRFLKVDTCRRPYLPGYVHGFEDQSYDYRNTFAGCTTP